MDYNEFKTQLVALTGRPDIAIAPYLIKTLATISRSGQYAEDMMTFDLASSLQNANVQRDWPLQGYNTYILSVGVPSYASIRALLRCDLIVLGEDENYYEVLVHTEPVATADTVSLIKKIRECPGKSFAYYVQGELMLTLCEQSDVISRLENTHGYLKIGINATLLTSNELKGGEFCYNEFSNRPSPPTQRAYDAVFPTEITSSSTPWQFYACLDLVLYGTAASQLRFAGHEKEAQLLYGEFLTGLRQFKADRDNQIIGVEGALGF